MEPLPAAVKELIEGKVYANFASLLKDGSPHVVQTWVDHEGDLILINTNEGSQKHKNVQRDPRVALDVCDPTNPYKVAVIRGRVKEITFDGAEAHIDKLAKKYLGQDKYPRRLPGLRRVLFKIEAEKVIAPFTDTSTNSRWGAWRAQARS